MRLHFTSAEGDFGGELYSNPVALDLAAELPLQATFSDYNGVEKVAKLARALRVEGVPDSAEPEPGEIGYYAPGQTLVLYYGVAGRWPGIVRIGRIDLEPNTLRDYPDRTVIDIDRSPEP